MSKILFIITSVLEILTTLLQRYKTAQTQKKYEEASTNTSNVWASGFGVQQTDKDAPTKTSVDT